MGLVGVEWLREGTGGMYHNLFHNVTTSTGLLYCICKKYYSNPLLQNENALLHTVHVSATLLNKNNVHAQIIICRQKTEKQHAHVIYPNSASSLCSSWLLVI